MLEWVEKTILYLQPTIWSFILCLKSNKTDHNDMNIILFMTCIENF